MMIARKIYEWIWVGNPKKVAQITKDFSKEAVGGIQIRMMISHSYLEGGWKNVG